MLLKIPITCGEETCASEPGVFCQFLGSRNLGMVPICCLFPSGREVYTNLYTTDGQETSWLARCPDCLKGGA